MVQNQSLCISNFNDKMSMFQQQQKKQKKYLIDNYIKCGKLFIGYSKINGITNYTTTGKYCKLINCLALNVSDSACSPI